MGNNTRSMPNMAKQEEETTTADMDMILANMTAPTTGVNLPTLKLFMVFIYSIMSLAIFFNLRVIYIITRILCKRQVSKSAARHACSNKHAFVYVLGLSVVDSFVLAHLPIVVTDILTGWVFGTAMCKLFWMIEQVNRILSTFILTALSGDRYLAICKPVQFRQFRTTKAAVTIIAISLVVGGASLTPTFVYGRVVSYQGPHNRSIEKCIFDLDTKSADRFLIYIFVCGYCIPFFFMVFFYWNILHTLWKKNPAAAAASETPMSTDTGSRAQRTQKRARHVTQRALVLVLFYFGCWTPYWAVQFYIEFVYDPDAPHTPSQDTLFVTLYVVHIFTYLNSAVNPFLYALLNKELQQQHSSSTSASVQSPNIPRQQADQERQRMLRNGDHPSPGGNRNCDSGTEQNAGSLITRYFINNRKRTSVEQDPNEMPLLMQASRINYNGIQDTGPQGQ